MELIKWHDVTCKQEKLINCEDVKGNIFTCKTNLPKYQYSLTIWFPSLLFSGIKYYRSINVAYFNISGERTQWHDVTYKHKKPIICEDVEGHIEFARQTFPNINIMLIFGSKVFY